jgi:signal transduction histidine kinase/DNA-binding response OmpR family regulator
VVVVVLLLNAYRIKRSANIKLAAQKAEIEEANKEISSQRDKLIEISEQLKEATQAKLRFFTNISHEIRTPLTLILGPMENMLRSGNYQPENLNQIKLMHRNATRLLRLINQIMDFRKLESDKMLLHAGEYDIIPFINDIKESFNELADQKQIDYDFITPVNSFNVWFDREKMDKVFINLLGNAFKFTNDEGKISILIPGTEEEFAQSKLQVLKIEVSDTGKGIKPEHQDKIFDRFFQIELSEEFHTSGTGIGLALAKSLIELHHGSISIKSSSDEEGTIFLITLPLGKDHLKPDEMVDKDDYDAPERDVLHFDEDFVKSLQAPRKSLKPDSDLVRKDLQNIIVVDDNEDIRTYVIESLKASYNVFEAADGKEGYELVMDIVPDLIISDVMMPEMDGLELTKKLKADIRTCHIPIILLTAKATIEHKISGLESGADSYIPKPFNSQHLQVRVDKLIEAKKRVREHYKENLGFEDTVIDLTVIDRRFLNKTMDLIEKNLSNTEFGVEELSEEIGMSRIHLYRKVKQLTDMTVSEYIRSIRVKKAASMLEKTGLSINQIANDTGFSTPSYFTKVFKQYYKVSPSDFAASKRD